MSDQHALLDQSYHAIVGQLPLAGLVFDATLRVRHANADCARLLGRDSLAALDLNELKGEGLLAALRAPLNGLNGAYDGPYMRGDDDLASGWIQLRTSPIRESNGKVAGGVAIFVDVSEKHRLEEQLRQAHRLEAFGRLAGGMAHDFESLLTSIRASADHAILALPPENAAREDLAEVTRAAERVAALTKQLLAFTRRQVLRFEILDPASVLRALEPKIREIAGADVTVEATYTAPTGAVCADRGQLEDLIISLVTSARAAMPNGGSLRVDVRAALLDGAEAAALVIADSGAPDDSARSRVVETSAQLVSELGGRLESERGASGASFAVLLPCGAEPAPPRVHTLQPSAPGAGETLLLVEDEILVRRSVRRILERQGYRVIDAQNGEDALRVCADHRGPIDLVLTDVVMPKMGGRALVDKLRERTPRLRALFMSGHDERGIAMHGVPKSHTFLIEKPFTTDALVARVREVLAIPVPSIRP